MKLYEGIDMHNNKGFTLIELMVTVIIAGIVAAIAVPASRNFQANLRVNTMANQYASFLKEARSLAIRNNRNVQVNSLNSVASPTNNWGGAGWRANEMLNGVASLYKEWRSIPATTQIFTTSGSPTEFRFAAGTGLAQNLNQTVFNMVFRVCDSGSRNERGYDVQVNQFGRISVVRHASAATCNP